LVLVIVFSKSDFLFVGSNWFIVPSVHGSDGLAGLGHQAMLASGKGPGFTPSY